MVDLHIVLTGASGYLGQHLLAHWIRDHGPIIDTGGGDGGSSSGSGTFSSIHITALYNQADKFPDAVQSYQKSLISNQDDDGQRLSSRIPLVVSTEKLDLCDEKQIQDWMKLVFHTDDVMEKKNSDLHVVVVHTAAWSSPRLCQEEPDKARKINVPKSFFDALKSLPVHVTMIALSTDQVYDGRQQQQQQQLDGSGWYTEEETDALNPVNVYGETKLEMEQYLQSTWSKNNDKNDDTADDNDANHRQQQQQKQQLHLLRSSIILGPKPPIDPQCAHDTFLHFVESRGISQESTTFFTNEYRTVISVRKVANIIDDLIVQATAMTKTTSKQTLPVVWNMGGYVRANRLEMAKTVFDHFGFDHSYLMGGEQTSSNVPLDISMNSSQLKKHNIGNRVKDETLKDLVEFTFVSPQW